jgi:hypothetical protein
MRENAVKLICTRKWREKARHSSGWRRNSGEAMKAKGAEEQSAAENEEKLLDLLFLSLSHTLVLLYVDIYIYK